MKSCHKTLFTIPARAPLTRNCITEPHYIVALIHPLQLMHVKQRHQRMWDWLPPLTVSVTPRARWWFLGWREVCWVSFCSETRGRNKACNSGALSVLRYGNNLTRPSWPQGGVKGEWPFMILLLFFLGQQKKCLKLSLLVIVFFFPALLVDEQKQQKPRVVPAGAWLHLCQLSDLVFSRLTGSR